MLVVSTCFRIVPITREKLTRAIETKNKLDVFYQSGSCPAKGKYALADGINLSFTTNTSTHTPNSNQLTSENKLIQKILKFNLHSSTSSYSKRIKKRTQKFTSDSLKSPGYSASILMIHKHQPYTKIVTENGAVCRTTPPRIFL